MSLRYKTLKRLGGVAEPKKHFGEFEKTKWYGDGRFENVVFSRGNLVVGAD